MKFAHSPNINHLWSSLIVEELNRNGVDYFCISPGSRSAPLAFSVAENPKAKSFIHFDERGCAFHALGYVSAALRPAVLISTSGTAVANFLPAIIEASKKKLPLVVLTADRPPELRQTGAPQTIDQVNIFGKYTRCFIDMPCPTSDIAPEFVLTTIDQAVHRAKSSIPGPAHLNCMFREPLAPIPKKGKWNGYLKNLQQWEKGNGPYTKYVMPLRIISKDQSASLVETLEKIKNGLIVVGKLANPAEQKGVLKLAEKLNWPVFPDVTSGIRIGTVHQHVISHFDQLLLSDVTHKMVRTMVRTKFNLDGILHLGGRITSKRYYQLIARLNPRHYLMVLNHPLRSDPLHKVTHRIEAPVTEFCRSITPLLAQRRPNPVIARLHKLSNAVSFEIQHFLERDNRISEPAVAHAVSELIPNHCTLFLASSMPIREFDMYAAHNRSIVTIGSNRGASGIDGTIATAAGFSRGSNKRVTLLTGDLAFLHDLNSLAMLSELKQPMVIIVLNNNGGGIFSFLPIAQYQKNFEKFFGTPHNLNFQDTAKMFDCSYHAPSNMALFRKHYHDALESPKSTIIEIKTNREENFKIHQKLSKLCITTIKNK